jgi:putative ABC transport system permease protein
MLVVVRQRTTEIATIKALGLKPRQTLIIFTWQIIFMGLLGSLVGIFIGIGLGFIMRNIVEQLFQRSLAWSLYPGSILTGLFVGTVVAGMFGLLPAFTASRIPPAKVLRQQGSDLPLHKPGQAQLKS